jgi:hypothetical protein
MDSRLRGNDERKAMPLPFPLVVSAPHRSADGNESADHAAEDRQEACEVMMRRHAFRQVPQAAAIAGSAFTSIP